jgi:hypothetical protein
MKKTILSYSRAVDFILWSLVIGLWSNEDAELMIKSLLLSSQQKLTGLLIPLR